MKRKGLPKKGGRVLGHIVRNMAWWIFRPFSVPYHPWLTGIFTLHEWVNFYGINVGKYGWYGSGKMQLYVGKKSSSSRCLQPSWPGQEIHEKRAGPLVFLGFFFGIRLSSYVEIMTNYYSITIPINKPAEWKVGGSFFVAQKTSWPWLCAVRGWTTYPVLSRLTVDTQNDAGLLNGYDTGFKAWPHFKVSMWTFYGGYLFTTWRCIFLLNMVIFLCYLSLPEGTWKNLLNTTLRRFRASLILQLHFEWG